MSRVRRSPSRWGFPLVVLGAAGVLIALLPVISEEGDAPFFVSAGVVAGAALLIALASLVTVPRYEYEDIMEAVQQGIKVPKIRH